MTNSFNALVLNHKNAAVHVREIVALDTNERQSLYSLIAKEKFEDFLIVSTCNRTEFYFNKGNEHVNKILRHLKKVKQLNNEVLSSFDLIDDNVKTYTHLMRVAIGLESLILGDREIYNQIKSAYQEANKMNLAGSFLHRLMHIIFFTHKKVVQETEFKNGTTSVAYHVANMMKRKSSEFVSPKLLVIGTGEIGKGLIKNFISLMRSNSKKDFEIYISNRTNEKAECLAARNEINFLPFESLYDKVNDIDIIVSAVNMNNYLINEEHIQARNWRHRYFFDLGMPRTISPVLKDLPGHVIYNIDEIRMVLSNDKNKRKQSIQDVESIIKESLNDFSQWSEKQQVSTAIKKLKIELENIRETSVKKYFADKNITLDIITDIEMMSKEMMYSVLKYQISKFNSACKNGDADTIIDTINDLFDVENVKAKIL